jgi:hypothetical protein
MTASLQATGGEAVRVINAGHAVNDGHSGSVEVRYDCCAFVLYGAPGPLALTIVTHLGTQLVTTPSPPETVRRTWLPKNSALPLSASRNMASTGAAACNRRAFRTNDQTVP